MIYSASSIWSEYKFNEPFHFAKYQLIFFLVSLFIMFIISKINYKFYYKYINIILFIAFLLLILVLIPGIGTIRNGSRSWFSIGPISMQPSEFAKISLIIFLAKYLSKNQIIINDIKKGLLPVLIIILIFFGLIILEPDMGTAMVSMLTLILIIFTSGVKISFFTSMGLLGLIGLTVLIIIAPYRV